jgi:hypothetical protein
MRFHIDQRTADNIHRGMPSAEARKEAEQRFGGVTRIQEQAYELEGTELLLFADDSPKT